MTFPVDYDKFTILSKVRNHFTIRMFRRANITHKPTPSFGGYFSSVTEDFADQFRKALYVRFLAVRCKQSFQR